MNELDQFISEGLSITETTAGSDKFRFEGEAREYSGILNEYDGEQLVEVGGTLSTYNATIVCQRGQFRHLGSPMVAKIKGRVVEIDGMKYSVDKASSDSTSVTLGLMIRR